MSNYSEENESNEPFTSYRKFGLFFIALYAVFGIEGIALPYACQIKETGSANPIPMIENAIENRNKVLK